MLVRRLILATVMLVLGATGLVAAKAQSSGMEIQAFDLRAILAPAESSRPDPLGFFPLDAVGFYPSAESEDEEGWSSTLDSDIVVQLLYQMAEHRGDPEWDENVSVELDESTLIVRADRERLDRVRGILASLERFVAERYAVRVFFLEAQGTAVPTGTLDRASCEELPGRAGIRVTAAHEGWVAPSGTIVLGESQEHSYVWDYDVEVAQSAKISDPQIAVLRTGRQVTARVERLQNGRFGLSVGAESVDPILPFRRVATRAASVGEIELPEMEAHRAGMHATIPSGGGLVFDFGAPGSYVLVTVAPAARTGGGGTAGELGWYSLGFLTRGVAPFAFQPRRLRDSVERVGARYVGESESGEGREPRSFMNTDAIANLMMESVARGVDDGSEHVDLIGGNRLLVMADQDRLAQVSSVLRGLEALRDRNVSLTVEVFEASQDAVAKMTARRRTAGPDAWTFDREASREMRRVLGNPIARCSMTALHGSSAAVFAGTERAILAQYDVEIAQDATIADPIEDYHHDGFALNVLPLLNQAGDRVTVNLSGELAHFELRGALESFGAEGIGGMDLATRRCIEIEASPILESGETRALLLQSDVSGDSFVVLVRADLSVKR